MKNMSCAILSISICFTTFASQGSHASAAKATAAAPIVQYNTGLRGSLETYIPAGQRSTIANLLRYVNPDLAGHYCSGQIKPLNPKRWELIEEEPVVLDDGRLCYTFRQVETGKVVSCLYKLNKDGKRDIKSKQIIKDWMPDCLAIYEDNEDEAVSFGCDH